MENRIAYFRFYQELNDFFPKEDKRKQKIYHFRGSPSVKDSIEAQGVPHTEVDLILVNGTSVAFNYQLKPYDYVSVYPVFESIDVGKISKLREKPLREVRFILDVHLGKLCRFLRLLGFDTYYDKTYDDPEIVTLANRENRIILTRDQGLLKRKQVTHGYWIRSQNPKKQLQEVVKRFDLYDFMNPFSRCVHCNAVLEKKDKQSVIDRLPAGTKEYYAYFSQCPCCKKVYWPGSHYERMKKFIRQIKNGDYLINMKQ